jgi:hypothetical protein
MKISMKLGPERTDKSKFQGFGLKAPSSSTSSSTGVPATSLPPKGSAAAKAKAKAGGVAALFRESLDDDGPKVSAVPVWNKPTMEMVQAQRKAEALQEEDPTVFQYDEVIDDVKRDMDVEVPSQRVRTEALEQKKRTGLTLMTGSEAVRVGNKRDTKYVEKVIVAVDRRKVEQQIVEDRLLKKEQEAREGREVFVTGAFKEELHRRKKFEEELEAQDLRDARRDATKQEDSKGFADFHRTLLNGGLATSRGGEKVLERAAPRIDLPQDEEPVKKEEEEPEEDKKAIKTEDDAMETEQHGVQDVQAPVPLTAKAAKESAEKETREDKALSARERFLARKRAAAEMSA